MTEIDLDPGSSGEWLAGVGLACAFTQGRWVGPQEGILCRFAPWRFEVDGLPAVEDIRSALDRMRANAADLPRTPWLNHRGNGTTARTCKQLIDALDEIPIVGAPEPHKLQEHTTQAGAGWEIDVAWQAPPSAYDQPTPHKPTVIAALAIIGAWHATRWKGHWPHKSLAVGHLWGDEGPEVHALDSWVVSWRRMNVGNARGTGPTAGPLGKAAWWYLGKPSWQQRVRRHLAIAADDLADIGDVAKRFNLDKAQVAKLRAAAKAGKPFDMLHGQGRVPPPLRKIGQAPVWASSDLEALDGGVRERIFDGDR